MKGVSSKFHSQWLYKDVLLGALAWALLFGISIMLLHSKGGVDLLTYSRNSEIPFDEWGVYFFKEIFSWVIIVFSYRVSDELGLGAPLLVLNSILFFIAMLVFRKTGYRTVFFMFVLVSPFSVLLVFNVLRQYLAVVFFLLSICSYVEGSKKMCVFLCLISILCHHSISFLMSVLFFSVYFNKRSMFFLIVLVQVLVFLMDSFLGLNLYDGGVNESGNVGESTKTIFSLAYVSSLYFFVRWAMHRFGSDVRSVEVKFIDGLFLFSLAVVFFPWQGWMVGRFLVYVAFIYLGYFYLVLVGGVGSKVPLLVILPFLFFNMMLIFFHPGAFDMLGWS